MAQALTRPELISLAAGFVDQTTLPVEAVRQAVDYVLSDPVRGQSALQYGTTQGDRPLREVLLDQLAAADGVDFAERGLTVDRVIATAGSNELLFLISETILDPGDIVLCGAPTYFVYLGALKNLGARSYGVAIDDEGVIPEALEDALTHLDAAGELDRVKAIYVTSYYDNPSSITLTAPRRAALVEIAKRFSRRAPIYVIDDAVYRELRYFGDDVPSLLAADEEADTVIHTSSFSKSFSPGVRVGWGMLPAELIDPVCNQKGNIDFGSPNLSQQIMATVLQLGLFDRHVERLRASYRPKLTAMLEALDEQFADIPGVSWTEATGGLYVWLKVGDVDTGSGGPLFRHALDKGVLYVPGIHCFPEEGEPPRTDMIRLSFGVQPPDRIRQGIALLAAAIGDVKSREGVAMK
jgi:2-aminoadipate transaminase